MSVLRLPRRFVHSFPNIRPSVTVKPNDNEYTANAEYPPILDLSYDKVLERKKEVVYEEIKAIKTVEEKQIKLNMPKYFGFKCYVLQEDKIPYNNLTLAQHITRTHLINSQTLPTFYNDIKVELDLTNFKGVLEEALLLELDGYQRIHDLKGDNIDKVQLEDIYSSSISKQLNRVLLNRLGHQNPHLINSQVDLEPRIEAFWYAGGMKPPENVKRYRGGQSWQKHKVDEPVNRLINYVGSAIFSLRNKLPLRPVVPLAEAENPGLEVPFWEYDPRTVGSTSTNKFMANIPGYWPGDPYKFGLLSIHKRGHMLARSYNQPDDDKEAIHRQGILASFSWLFSQANMLGFTTFNDITYPLVTQTAVTNGQFWSFYIYQLNTLSLHSKHIYDNPKRNICWSIPELKLFEQIKDGKLIGFNDDILKILVKLYSNVPEERLGINMTPYLNHDEKIAADYEDIDKRKWLEKEYKFLVANRPRYKLTEEIYAWEKIYKIDNETRFMDTKRRKFEFGIKWSNRRLDERKPEYIPRALRPHLPKNRGRDAKEYFP